MKLTVLRPFTDGTALMRGFELVLPHASMSLQEGGA
jgi:hypothetical protein